MFKRWIFVYILIFLTYLIYCQPFQAKIKSEIHELNTFRLLVDLNYNQLRSIVIQENLQVKALGFSSPWFVIGPLNRYGLLREIYNPLGYSPASDIYSEKTNLKLKGSFSYSRYQGLVFNPLPPLLSFYLIDKVDYPWQVMKHNTWQLGGVLNLPISKFFYTEFLMSTSEGKLKNDYEEWFSKIPVFPGARIINLAQKIGICGDFYNIIITNALSTGELVEPGNYSYALLGFNSNCMETKFFGGVCNGNYLSPEFEYNKNWLGCGFYTLLSPAHWFNLSIEYKRDFEHKEVLPVTFLGGSGKLNVCNLIKYEVGKNLLMGQQGEFEYTCYYKKAGAIEQARQTDFEFFWKYNFSKYTLLMGLNQEKAKGIETVFGFEIEYILDVFKFDLILKRIEKHNETYSGRLEFLLKPEENYNIFLHIYTLKPIAFSGELWQAFKHDVFCFLTLSLGWEVDF
jgi:hypothetical protein